MIARVAESCFWLHRYIERVDNMARLMAVNFNFMLDVPPGVIERWRPLLVVAGEEERYLSLHGPESIDDGERVQQYLIWEQENPVSALNSLKWARENGRTIRETLSLEAWTVLNRFWLWMGSNEARELYVYERATFYERVREHCQLFHGVCHDTLLHEEPFEFMRLGMFLERAAQTARILDTKFHAVGPTREEGETSIEAAEWIAILRSCSAYEPFFKRAGGSLSGPAVAGFLLFDPAFPRSVMHCLMRGWNFLTLIGGETTRLKRCESARLLDQLMSRLRTRTIHQVIEHGLHEELTCIVEGLAAVCHAVESDYFAGLPPEVSSSHQVALQL